MCLIGLLAPASANASLSLADQSVVLNNRPIGSIDIAFDASSGLYLVVFDGGDGPIMGVFVNSTGEPTGVPFPISTGLGYAPRVAADNQGNFAVNYGHATGSGTGAAFSRRVRFVSPVNGSASLSGEFLLAHVGFGEAFGSRIGGDVVYVPAAGHFLVGYYANADSLVQAVTLAGPKTAPVPVTQGGVSGCPLVFPELAVDPVTSRVLVAGMRADCGGNEGIWVRLINGVTGAPIAPMSFASTGIVGHQGVAFSEASGLFVVVWADWARRTISGAQVDVGGQFGLVDFVIRQGAPSVFSAEHSFGQLALDYNRGTGTFLVAAKGHDQDGPDSPTYIAELASDGTPLAGGFQVLPGSLRGPAPLPKIASHAAAGQFAVVYKPLWSRADSAILQGVGGTPQPDPQPPPPPPPPVPTSTPHMAVDTPVSGPIQQPFQVAGWAVDLGATVGTGVDAVHVWATPTAGGPSIFLGVASYGVTRPGVGAAFGPQFANSGYGLIVNGLPFGAYELVVYAFSSVSGTFNNAQPVSIFVTESSPVMSLDIPLNGATVAQPFVVAGWALDRGAPTGTGVSTVHVWALPVGGGPNRFLGVAALRGTRPDVTALYGPQFARSGFSLTVTGGLAPGVYDIVAFAHSVVTQTFADARAARVTVQ